jgi:MarR-like DNA-binding transcriptional regulator SgrR of sgrS sRNA
VRTPIRYHRHQQRYLVERPRPTDATAPAEEYWTWRGNPIHLDRHPNPDAPTKIVLLHGAGTNGRQMTLILTALLAQHGFETVALGYDLTQAEKRSTPSDLVVDLLAHERARDDRPIVLYLRGPRGMLAYRIAATTPKDKLRGIVSLTPPGSPEELT